MNPRTIAGRLGTVRTMRANYLSADTFTARAAHAIKLAIATTAIPDSEWRAIQTHYRGFDVRELERSTHG